MASFSSARPARDRALERANPAGARALHLVEPADQLDRALMWAIGRSPFIHDAKDRPEAWEQRFGSLRAGSR